MKRSVSSGDVAWDSTKSTATSSPYCSFSLMEAGTDPPMQFGQRVPQKSINTGLPRRSAMSVRPMPFCGVLENLNAIGVSSPAATDGALGEADTAAIASGIAQANAMAVQ
jgi:hypothetical protein